MVLCAVAALLLLYLFVAIFFVWHFEPKSSVNGVDLSGLTLAAAREKLKEVADGYQLKVKGPGGDEVILSGNDLKVSVTDASNAQSCLKAQPKLTWIAAVFREKPYTVDLVMDFDEDALSSAMDSMDMLNPEKMTEPADAYLEQQGDGTRIIVPEVMGTTLDTEKARSLIYEAVRAARTEVDLDPAHIKPAVYSDDEGLKTRMTEWNALITSSGLTYHVGDTDEVMDGPVIASLLDDDGEHVTVSYAKTADLMADWKSRHDTYHTSFEFTTHSGNTVWVQPWGDYGFELDEEGTCADVMEKINSHDKGKYKAKYFHEAPYDFNKGLGGDYVEINIDRQYLWVYKDGEVVVDTEVVTGLPVFGRVTYYGCYSIKKKVREITLGDLEVEGYETLVHYWLPFNSGEGIHDAYWREYFGGKIWLTNGSHGCVNVPEWCMEDVFDNVEVGEAVVIYGTEYDEKVNDPSIKTVDEEYYYREFYGE